LFAALGCEPVCGCPRRKPPWFEHEDLATGQIGVCHRQRHAGGFARPRRGLQDGPFVLAQSRDEIGQDGVDGQGGHAGVVGECAGRVKVLAITGERRLGLIGPSGRI